MNLIDLRNAVRAYNVIRARGVTSHPEAVYGRDERGYTDSIGDRTDVESAVREHREQKVVIATVKYSAETYDFHEEAKDAELLPASRS